MFKRRFHDNLVMARMQEDIDSISNTNKEDKMLITGLTSKTPKPTGAEDARKWLKDIVSEILDKIEIGSSAKIVFITQGRSRDREVPLAEVRMSDREVAKRLRKKFANQRKAGQDFGRVQITNCVTLAPRVRIDILKAMAKKFTSDQEDLFVYGYASRPVLHNKPKDQKKPMWLTFSDALVRFGSGLRRVDLEEAYRRTGVAFRGQLQQNFVVLHEDGAGNNGRVSLKASTSVTVMGTPKKRTREEVGVEPDSKTPRKRAKPEKKK
jgi:hypothetical protein